MKLFFLLWLLVLPVMAGELHYLTADAINADTFPAPPLANSKVDQSDLAAVLQWQETRTTLDCERAFAENEGTAQSFYAPPYGPMTQAQADQLAEFHERLFDEVNFFVRLVKEKWQRPRPFMRSADVNPCVPVRPSHSYPSGHAAAARISALTFSKVHPRLRLRLIKRAQVIAQDRVVGGVHNPTDVSAGLQLADLVFAELMKLERFRADVEGLK